jgi:prefoldin subunit 5
LFNTIHVCFVEETAALHDKEAQHLIKKIRRQVRLLNRKWAEVNQGCNEWQSRIETVSKVDNSVFILYLLPCYKV